MIQLILLDVAPDPVGSGALIAIVMLAISGFIILAAAALAVFLWYRKRSLGTVEMIRPDTLPAEYAQPGKPNHL
jgi:hypothetical protein